jgi:hypothetical protein
MRNPTDEEKPIESLRKALQDLASGRVRPIEDVIKEAKDELHRNQ